MDFEPGDVVSLKSAGEPMTVEGVSDGKVNCVWMNGKKIERGTFPSVTLVKFAPPKSSVAVF
jgi:uncharacterized protein YodC (DUF2158 family)